MKNQLLKMANVGLVGVLLVVQTACGNSGSRSGSNGSSNTAEVQQPTIDMAPYMFSAEPCEKEGGRYYKKMSSFGGGVLQTDNSLSVSIDLYFLADGTYIADLEVLKPEPDVSPNTSAVVETKHYKNTWSTSGYEVVLNGLGSAIPLTYNGEPALDLKMSNVATDPVFNGTQIFVQKAFGNYAAPELESKCN